MTSRKKTALTPKSFEPEQFAVSEIDVIYKSKTKACDRPQISCSEDAHKVLRASWDENKIELCEQFKVLYLDRGNRVKALFNVSSGGITGTVADPRMILQGALAVHAVSMIMAHNHPSGNLRPSRADEDLTCKISHAAKYHDMRVQDHLILTADGSYFSFADEGLNL